MFKLQSPPKHSTFATMHLPIHFFHCSKQFELVDFDAVTLMSLNESASAVFRFHLFYISNTFPFEDFFPPGETKNSYLRGDRMNREGGARWSSSFWSKTAEHSGVPVNHP